MVMQLRYYQQEAIDAAWRALEEEPDSNPCIVLPTGAGKTPVVAALCKQMFEWGGKTVVLTHVKELVQQNYNTLVRNAPELKHDIGVYSAGLNKRDTGHDILVAGIQSIYRRAYQIDVRNLIIIDESHLIPTVDSGMYRTFLKAMKINNPHVKIIGLTATPYRLGSGYICQPDGILNKICYEADVKTLIEEGYLSRLISAAGVTKTDLSGVHIRGGDYVESELQTAMNKDATVLEACKELVASTAERKSILVFAAGVEHGENILQKLRDLGQNADSIYGDTKNYERDAKISRFKAGQIKFLVNVGVLTTGFDYPGIDCVALLRPTLSPGLYYQMCLDSETEILTARGWVGREEILANDLIAATDFSTATPTLNWEKSIEIIDRQVVHGEQMISINSDSVSIRVTDSHDMVVSGRGSRENWKKESAIKTAQRASDFRIPVASIESTSGVDLTDDEIKFIGWVLTDGHINKANSAIYISQSTIQPHFNQIELVLKACGFKYGKRLITHKTQFNESAPRYMFSVSKGAPRGRDKHLRGWGHLEQFVSKDFASALEGIDERQFEILLEAINLGDGSKHKGQGWVQRSYHISTGNKLFADRLQSLCVRRGWRCNLSRLVNNNGNPIYFLHAKKQAFRAIGGQNQLDRERLVVSDAIENERVWCVKVPSGAFIARRLGKAFITGNCGRGLRLADGKKECLILDFGGNILRHGPIDMIKIKPKKAGNSEPGEAPAKECPKCNHIIAAAATVCPFCGEIFLREVKHETQASHAGILSNEAALETKEIEAVYYSKHTKRGAPYGTPSSMKVSYHCKGQYFGAPDIISEWVCFEHEGYARQKALQWWKKRVVGVDCPNSVDAALELLLERDMSNQSLGNGILPTPKSITVSQPKGDEKFPRIVGYEGVQAVKFEEAHEHPEDIAAKIAARWGAPQEAEPAYENAGYSSQEESFDDVPF